VAIRAFKTLTGEVDTQAIDKGPEQLVLTIVSGTGPVYYSVDGTTPADDAACEVIVGGVGAFDTVEVNRNAATSVKLLGAEGTVVHVKPVMGRGR
jgi:hypothetical protein